MSLTGMGCLAHILNNCLQHGMDTSDLDVPSVVVKIYIAFQSTLWEMTQWKSFVISG
jgi:hypothetical protein